MSQDTIRNVQRAWFEDGVWEIGFGLAFVIVSLYAWLSQWLDLSNRLGLWLMLLQVAVYLGAFGAVRGVMGVLKQRFTFPRTGYATYRRPTGRKLIRRAILAGVIGAVSGAAGVILRLSGQPETHIPAVLGLVLGGLMVAISTYYGLTRFLWIGLLTLVWGMLVAWMGLPVDPGVSLLISGFSLLVLLDGVVALARFVRRYPVEPDEASE